MQPTRFEIEDRPARPARGTVAVSEGARRASAWLGWVELAFFLPTRLVAAFSWLLIPLLVFAAVPLVILGTLLIVQAPIFFLLWKLFAAVPSNSAESEESPPQP
jgi:hypothetical protein